LLSDCFSTIFAGAGAVVITAPGQPYALTVVVGVVADDDPGEVVPEPVLAPQAARAKIIKVRNEPSANHVRRRRI